MLERDGVVVVVVMVEHAVVVLWRAPITAQAWKARLIAVWIKRENIRQRRRRRSCCSLVCCCGTSTFRFRFGRFADAGAWFLGAQPGLDCWSSRLDARFDPGGSSGTFGHPPLGGRSDGIHIFVLPLKTIGTRLWSSRGIGPPAKVYTPRL